MGDTIVVNVIVNGVMGQALTGVEFYIRFDPEFLFPIDADTVVSGLQPVRSEGLITGSNEIANEFNTENPNKYNGIIYAEGLLSGITSSDSGLVASMSFRMIQPIPHGGEVIVSVEPDTATFRSSFQIQTAEGLTFPLTAWNALHLAVPPPLLDLPVFLAMRRDSTLVLDLIPLASDPDYSTNQLEWAVSAQDSGFVVTIDDPAKEVSVKPPDGYTGETILSITVTNPAGGSASGDATLRVNPANRPPVIIEEFPTEFLLVGGSSEPIDLSLFVSDSDVPVSFLRWTFSGGSVVAASVDENQILSITAPADWRDQETLTLIVTDPESAFDSVTFTVEGAIPGDFTGDGKVDFDDFFEFAAAFNSEQDDPDFDPKFDMDNSGKVDLDDFFIFAESFGG